MGASFFPIPEVLLSMAAGMIWGPYLGTFYTIMGASLSSILPFFIGRFLGRECAGQLFRKFRLKRVDDLLSANGFLSILILRLIPVIPWEMVNYIGGICGIRFRDYLLGTLIGTLPTSYLFNAAGASLGGPVDRTRILLAFISVIFLAGGYLAVRLRLHR